MQQHSTLKNLWRFLRPEPEELIFYTLVVIILAGIGFYRVAVQGQVGAESQDVIAGFNQAKDTLYTYFNDRDGWGRFFLFGFWFIIGTIVYILAWALITTLIDLSNDIKISSSFAHPKSFHQSDFWFSIAMRAILRGTAGIALIFYCIFWIASFGPVAIDSLQAPFTLGFTQGRIIDFLATLVSVAITLHIAAILLRIMLLKAHYSYEK